MQNQQFGASPAQGQSQQQLLQTPIQNGSQTQNDATQTPNGKWRCNFCNKEYLTKYSLRRHIRNHTGERPFACHLCGKRFTQKPVLKTHIRTHTGERPYHCQICNKSFISTGALSRHRWVHKKEGTWNDSMATNNNNNNINNRNHRPNRSRHIKIKNEARNDRYQCHMCNLMFRETEYTTHIMTHIPNLEVIPKSEFMNNNNNNETSSNQNFMNNNNNNSNENTNNNNSDSYGQNGIERNGRVQTAIVDQSVNETTVVNGTFLVRDIEPQIGNPSQVIENHR